MSEDNYYTCPICQRKSVISMTQRLVLAFILRKTIWKEKRMTKPTHDESDTIARLALGLVIFLLMRFAPRAIEAWQKRKDMKGEMR